MATTPPPGFRRRPGGRLAPVRPRGTTSSLSLRVEGPQLRPLLRELHTASNGKQLRAELRGRFTAILRPMVPKVRAAYRANPSGQGAARRRGGSLRGALARATRVEVLLSGRRAGARIRVDGRRMPKNRGRMGRIPNYYEGTRRPWKHPVYGNPDVARWAIQQPVPTFYRTVRPDQRRARREAEQAVEAVFKKIARAR